MDEKLKKLLLSVLIVFLFVGCSSTIVPSKPVTTAQDAVAKQEKKVDTTLDNIEKVEKGKKVQTSTLSAGIQYTLNQVSNPPVQVNTAKALNERVVSIVGSPHIDEIKRIKATVDLLNSQVAEERKKGEALLAERDEIINKLQKDKNALKEKYDEQLWQMTDKAKEVAKDADQSKAVLDSMSGMFGLNAVFWGLKKFFVSCLTGILIFGAIFILLRILATVNPAAGAAFSIFNMIGSAVLSVVKSLTPKAFEMTNFVPTSHSDKYKETLTKIVDSIQELKEKQKDDNSKMFALSDILKRFDKELDGHEKELIDEILKEQKWIK